MADPKAEPPLRPRACGCSSRRRKRLHKTYDSYYCPDCRGWLEEQCGDPACEFCRDRPARAPGPPGDATAESGSGR